MQTSEQFHSGAAQPPAAPRITIGTGASGFTGISRWRETAKLLLRSWRYPDATRDWLAAINTQPLLRALVAARPRLIVKVHRPYLTTTLAPVARQRVLRAHYDFMLRHGLGRLTLQAARTGVVLAEAAGKSGVMYRLALRAIEPMEREGELVLQLLREDRLLYSTAFTFLADDGAMVLGVGCMQGAKEDGLDLIRQATRDLHGLRPKHLLLRLLGTLGHGLGCASLRLVGNANRAAWRARKQGKVHADYDGFWRECGAVPRADGDYQLACAPPAPPDLPRIPSHKRSEARKRHQLTVALATALAQAFLPS